MTIAEIARIAGTSRGTVDRVINKRGKVNKELEDRILKVIEETGFVPNTLASRLSQSKRDTKIGAIIGSVGNPFFGLVIQGLKKRIARYSRFHFGLSVREVQLFDEEGILGAIESLKEQGIDLLIAAISATPKIVAALDELSVPIIALNNDFNCQRKIGFIGCDYVNSGALAGDMANVIIPQGSANIAVISGSLSHFGQKGRLEGFKSVLRPELCIIDILENNDDDETSYELTGKLLSKKAVDLIYFCGAGIAGGLRAVLESGNRPLILCVDQQKEVVEGLRSGLVSASVTQHPYSQGLEAIEMAYDVFFRGLSSSRDKILESNVILKHSVIPHTNKEEKIWERDL